MEQTSPIPPAEAQPPVAPISLPPPPPGTVPPRERSRPPAVTGIAIYMLILCVFMCARMIISYWRLGNDFLTADPWTPAIMLFVVLAIGICGLGLLFLQRWARIGALILHVIIVVIAISTLIWQLRDFTSDDLPGIAVLSGSLLASIFAFILLLLKSNKVVFAQRYRRKSMHASDEKKTGS